MALSCVHIQSPTAHREQHPVVKVAGRLKNPVTQLAPLGLKQACTGATEVANLHPDRQAFGVLEVRSEQLGLECIMWLQNARTPERQNSRSTPLK